MKNPAAASSTSKWLGVIVALQVITLIGQWVATPAATPAMAQIPDAGAQRLEIIQQLKGTNDRLDKLVTLLGSGNLQVKVAKPDDIKGQ